MLYLRWFRFPHDYRVACDTLPCDDSSLQRQAYGFRNFQNYRLRVKVLCCCDQSEARLAHIKCIEPIAEKTWWARRDSNPDLLRVKNHLRLQKLH